MVFRGGRLFEPHIVPRKSVGSKGPLVCLRLSTEVWIRSSWFLSADSMCCHPMVYDHGEPTEGENPASGLHPIDAAWLQRTSGGVWKVAICESGRWTIPTCTDSEAKIPWHSSIPKRWEAVIPQTVHCWGPRFYLKHVRPFSVDMSALFESLCSQFCTFVSQLR